MSNTQAKELRRIRYNTNKFFESILDFFIGSYFLMLGMGALHHDTFHWLPAVDFWHAALVLWTVWQFVPVGVFRLNGINYILEERLGYRK